MAACFEQDMEVGCGIIQEAGNDHISEDEQDAGEQAFQPPFRRIDHVLRGD